MDESFGFAGVVAELRIFKVCGTGVSSDSTKNPDHSSTRKHFAAPLKIAIQVSFYNSAKDLLEKHGVVAC